MVGMSRLYTYIIKVDVSNKKSHCIVDIGLHIVNSRIGEMTSWTTPLGRGLPSWKVTQVDSESLAISRVIRWFLNKNH